VGALFGFARLLQKILKQHHPDGLAVCFDTPAPTFRHKAFADYKAHRKDIDDALRFQLPLAREMVSAWGLAAPAMEGYEADDVIATLARRGEKEGWRVLVVTGDKDALQLVTDRTAVWNESKNLLLTPAEVQKKYGLSPAQLVDFFALTGDASDNVPGVAGVGEKTATELLKTHHSVAGLYAHVQDVKGSLRAKLEAGRESAQLSRELVTLDDRVPLSLAPADCPARPAGAPALVDFFKRYEFKALLAEVGSSPGPMAPARSVSSRRVRVVLTEEDLADVVKELKAAREVAVDVETTGTDSLRDALVGISLSTKPGEAWYIPLAHRVMGSPAQLPLKKIQAALAPRFADPSLPKDGQNLKFDLQVLRRYGLPLAGLGFDTLIASYCLNPSRLSHGLKQLAADLLGETMTPIEALIGSGSKQTTMDQVEVSRAAEYAGADAEMVLRLKALMAPELAEKKMEALFRDVEMPLVEILADMEAQGMGVDRDYLVELQKEFARDIARLEAQAQKLAGQPVNLNSPKQLAALFFETLKLPAARRTKTGFSTDEDTLRRLSPLHPLPAAVLEYRERTKLKNTYIDALIGQADPESSRVHGRFNQAVAATGRLSSSDPNLQNIPIRTDAGRRIRRAFVPARGHVFLSADYSQIDLRVLAHISRDKALVEAFLSGGDVHSATAREIFGLAADQKVDEESRRVAKSVNFGIVYGQTPFGLSQQLGIPQAQAKEYIERYLARYAGVARWMKEIVETARKDGYVTTLLNRRRYLPEIKAPNPAVRGFAERTALNTPIQGTSADIIKVAMIRAVRELARERSRTRLLCQVHDDLLFEVPRDELASVSRRLKAIMESAMTLSVPLVVDLKTGPNWADMEKYENCTDSLR
jgi:DNA polymerase-1